MIPNIKHILYATDLSANARKAMAYAVGLADAYGASLTILHVMEEASPNAEVLSAAFLGYGSTEEMREKNQEQIIEEIRSRLGAMCDELGCQLPACRFTLSEVQIETGNPSTVLEHKAASGAFDLFVMGRHDYGLLEEIMLGHSSKQVLRHSPIPILLIPIGEAEKKAGKRVSPREFM